MRHLITSRTRPKNSESELRSVIVAVNRGIMHVNAGLPSQQIPKQMTPDHLKLGPFPQTHQNVNDAGKTVIKLRTVRPLPLAPFADGVVKEAIGNTTVKSL